MVAKRKHKKSIILRLLILGVSVYMIATLINLWNTLNESRNQLEKLENDYRTVELRVEELKSLLADGSQAQIIEKAARERLGYVYSDEEIYIDISGS